MNSPQVLQQRYRDLMKAKLANIKTLKDLELGDPNVEGVLKPIRELYARKLDVVDEGTLKRLGGEVLGFYYVLGVTLSIKRAERDAAEQSYEELLSSVTLMYKDEETGVTEARAIAKEQMGEFAADILTKEQIKNSYEAIYESADRTISFVQSLMRMANSERSKNNLADEH